MSDAPRPRPAFTSTLAVAAVTLFVLLVAVWAAAVGPDDPLRADGITPDRVTLETPSQTQTPAGGDRPATADQEREQGTSVLPAVVGLLVLSIGVALGLALLWLLVSQLWRVRHVRLRREGREPDLAPLDPVLAVASAMVLDAAEQEDLLTTGSPRNAVVQCWHRFEVQAQRAGTPRQDSETSSEFTLRLLATVRADPGSVSRLADLYREARFSEHELGEDARADALEILRTIHRDLRVLAGGVSP